MENRPLKNRKTSEEVLIRKRERDHLHAETWNTTVKYYNRFDKENTKFGDWTSPRYYKTNNELMAKIETERNKKESLVIRREKLKRLLDEEAQSYGIELMIKNRDQLTPRSKLDEIPCEILKDINDKLKIDEEVRRKNEAEKNLYKHWRSNQDILRDCQVKRNTKDIKLSWLDQQIEKRMAREKEEEQIKKALKEKEEYLQQEKKKDEEIKREFDLKREELKEYLEKQINEVLEKEAAAEELKQHEAEEIKRRSKLLELQEKRIIEERTRQEKEMVLNNLKEHRRKLELKSKNIEEELESDQLFIEELKKSTLLEKIEDQNKKIELKRATDEFLGVVRDLKDLEKKRQEHLSFVFDSEAKIVAQKFNEVWKREQEMRSNLIKDMLVEINTQTNLNIERKQEKQKEILLEREKSLEGVKKYKEEIESLHQFEENRKLDYKNDLLEQMKENKLRKKHLANLEQKQMQDEVEKLRSEEQRMKNEISKIQSGKHCPTYGRRRFFY